MKMSNREKRNSKTTWKEWKQEKITWVVKLTEEEVVYMGSMSKTREKFMKKVMVVHDDKWILGFINGKMEQVVSLDSRIVVKRCSLKWFSSGLSASPRHPSSSKWEQDCKQC